MAFQKFRATKWKSPHLKPYSIDLDTAIIILKKPMELHAESHPFVWKQRVLSIFLANKLLVIIMTLVTIAVPIVWKINEVPSFKMFGDVTRDLSHQTMADLARNGAQILAFGDSLTHGYCVENKKLLFKPYSENLQRLLGSQVKIVEAGVVGELASSMIHRLPDTLHKHPLSSIGIFLAGTNDLGHHKSPAEIANHILNLHKIMHHWTCLPANNSRPCTSLSILLTIPQISWPINEKHRLIANQMLREYVQSCAEKHRVALVDLESAWDQTDPQNAIFWSPDKVHLSEAGYKDLAQRVWKVMETFDVYAETPNASDVPLPSSESLCPTYLAHPLLSSTPA